MSFNIQLMRNNSEANRLSKNLTNITTVSGTLKQSTSIINPIIQIECDISNVTDCNYMYIPTFERYYFVDNITSLTSDIVEFTGHVDVLTTYASQIRSNNAIVKRQENRFNTYLNDGSFKTYQDPIILTRAFPQGFTTQEFVLAVAGS